MARILLDTNVWRELVDRNDVERLRRAARDNQFSILIAPGVVYEMLRTPDRDVRRRQVRAVTLQAWTRLMTEVFMECQDLRDLLATRRPQWLVARPDLAAFHRLRADWAAGGFWRRARRYPDREAGIIAMLEGDRFDRARREAHETRALMGHLQFDSIQLDGWTSRLPFGEPGWDGTDVDAWRVRGAAQWWDQLIAQPSAAHLDWLTPFLDRRAIAGARGSWNHLWYHELDRAEVPREWLRWAVGWLQGVCKVTPGTPGDNQISVYSYEADVLLTGDRAFADIINRVRVDAPMPVCLAERLMPGTDPVDVIIAVAPR
jgi:hypothetical protein